MTEQTFPVVRVSGTPFEIGRQHGTEARERVSRSVAIYRDAFARDAGLHWPSVLKQSTEFAHRIETYDANILAEMAGIAGGAGFTLEEIVAINCRTEILFGNR